MAHNEPPHQDLRCLQMQLGSSLVLEELENIYDQVTKTNYFLYQIYENCYFVTFIVIYSFVSCLFYEKKKCSNDQCYMLINQLLRGEVQTKKHGSKLY